MTSRLREPATFTSSSDTTTTCSSSSRTSCRHTSSSFQMRLSNVPHRSSSQELVELEEQFQQEQELSTALRNVQQVDDNDDEEEDDQRWNPTTSSPSDDDDDDDDDDDMEDDDDSENQAQLSSMSDTDDSVDSGQGMRNDGTCGAVEDALLQFTRLDSSSTTSSCTDLKKTSVVVDDETWLNHHDKYGDDDEYSPKRKAQVHHTSNSISSSVITQYPPPHNNKKRRFLLSRFRRLAKKQDTVPTVFDFEQYMLKREMNVTQEKWNALTVLPNPMYCLYFILSAQWYFYYSTMNQYSDWFNAGDSRIGSGSGSSSINDSSTSSHGCLSPSSWHSMPVLPPLPVLAVVLGICVHAPWSFLYHWTYAHTMSATQRTKHWSRRMDQSFIHVASSFMCYGTSGSIQYFLVNTLYNLDCIRRQFRPTVRPKQNQMRIIISIIAYTLPLLKHGDYSTFLQLWVLFSISGYFFIHYPVGGWSHAVFHIVIALVPPLLLRTATALPVSQTQLYRAAWCTAASTSMATATGSVR